MLSGHSDVVPVDGQDWASDPFKLEPRDGKLYARGSADMKSFIAVMLAKVPEFVTRSLAVPIHLALTYDEEVGCLGVRSLIAALAPRAVKPRLCVIGEPTLMKPVVAHKGSRRLRCHVHGHEAHSSLTHQGVNAIEAAAAVITHINGIAKKRRASGPFDPAFDPPYTTLQTGLIAGGTAVNIVPNECRFDFEMRHLPDDDPDVIVDDVKRFAASLLPEMQAVSAQAGIAFEETNTVAALSAKPDEEVVQLALVALGRERHGQGQLRDRRRLFPARRHPDRHLRSRLDRAGAQSRRIHRSRPGQAMRRFYRPADRARSTLNDMTASGSTIRAVFAQPRSSSIRPISAPGAPAIPASTMCGASPPPRRARM